MPKINCIQRISRRVEDTLLWVLCCSSIELFILTEVLFVLAGGHSNRQTRERAVPALNNTLLLFTCKEVSTKHLENKT